MWQAGVRRATQLAESLKCIRGLWFLLFLFKKKKVLQKKVCKVYSLNNSVAFKRLRLFFLNLKALDKTISDQGRKLCCSSKHECSLTHHRTVFRGQGYYSGLHWTACTCLSIQDNKNNHLCTSKKKSGTETQRTTFKISTVNRLTHCTEASFTESSKATADKRTAFFYW